MIDIYKGKSADSVVTRVNRRMRLWMGIYKLTITVELKIKSMKLVLELFNERIRVLISTTETTD